MARIIIENDHKEKWQSFTASIDFEYPLTQICAYGRNESEAIENLRVEIEKCKNQLTGIDYSNFEPSKPFRS